MSDTDTTTQPPVINPDQPYRMPDQQAVQDWRNSTPMQPLAPQSPLSPMAGYPAPPPAPPKPPQYPALNVPPMPQAPTEQKLGPAPDAKEYQKDAMAWASAFAVLGAIAGRFTRAPGGAALSAFASALKGWQSGNLQQYQQAADKWEKDSKAALENNRIVLEKYKIALQDRQMNIDQQMSQIQLIATQYHDQIMYDAAASKNYTLVAQKYEKGVEWQQKATEAQNKLIEKKQKDEENGAYWLTPAGQQHLAQLPPEQQAGPKRLIDVFEKKGLGRSNIAQNRQQFIDEYTDENGHPPSSALVTEWEADRAGKISAARVTASAEPRADASTLTALTKQKASIESFERTAIANGEKLKQLADKVDKTGVPAIERWIRGGRQATGDVDVAEFNTQMNVYRAEVAKIVTNPNLSGVLSDSARREVDSFLSGGASAKQIRAVVDLLTQDFGRRSQSIDDEIETVRSHLKGGKGATPAAAPPSDTPAAGTGGGGTIPPGWDVQVH